jgi:penicillin-binding protein 1A
VYAPALESGIINWASVYDDVPVSFSEVTSSADATNKFTAWPKNANGVYRGLTNVNYAIEHSVNTVTVRVLEALGLDNSFSFLKDTLGFNGLIESKTLNDGTVITDIDYAALALGQFNYGLSLREVTAAYSIFPNRGIYNGYRSYYKITDSANNVILENKYNGNVALSEENAIIMTKMLQNVIQNGTAKGITLKKEINCAGKTGTTQNTCDRWFVGFTPYLIGGVWYGYEYPKTLDSASSSVCIEIWNEIMTKLHKKYILNGNAEKFNESDKIDIFEYCADSGRLATDACKKDPRGNRIESGYFVKGTEPSEKCDRHVLVEYDKLWGGVADHECPFTDTEHVGFIRVNRSFPMQIYVSDAQYVWRDISNETMPETDPRLPFFSNLLKENEYSGISYGAQQYNRYCRAHFDYEKWKKKPMGDTDE